MGYNYQIRELGKYYKIVGTDKQMKEVNKWSLILGSLAALGCEGLYGLSYIFTKQATNQASVLALLGWRFVIAFVVMSGLIAVGFVHIDLRGKAVKPLLLVSLFNPVLYFVGETVGISHTTASESGVFLACIPVASLLASTLILHKRPSRQQVIGILMTLVGVIITVVAAGTQTSLSVVGYLFLLLAVGTYALYSVFVEKAKSYTGIEITYLMLAAGAIVFSVLAVGEAVGQGNVGTLLRLPLANMKFLEAVLYQGIGSSVIALFLSNFAIAKIGVNQTSSFIGISTVVSIVAGIFILGEQFNGYQFLGAAVIILGVYVANMTINLRRIR